MKAAGVLLLVLLVIAAPAVASDKPARFTLSVVVAGLGIADTALTIWGTRRGAVELNGLWKGLLERRQYFALWTLEAVGTGVIVLALNILIHNKPTRLAGYVLAGTVILARSYIVWHNAKVNGGLR